jgi:hypothetical protein
MVNASEVAVSQEDKVCAKPKYPSRNDNKLVKHAKRNVEPLFTFRDQKIEKHSPTSKAVCFGRLR